MTTAEMELLKRITADPKIFGGKPIVRRRVTGLRKCERRHPGHGGEQRPTDQMPSGVDGRPLGAHPL